MLGKFISVLFITGLIAFTIYEIVQIVRVVKERKKAKSIKKEYDENGRDSDS